MNIAFPLFPNTTQLDLTGPLEVFSNVPGAKVCLVAAALDPVRSDKGLRLLPDLLREDCPPLDVLCVPGGAGVNDLIQDDAWLDFLAEQGAEARYVTSVCTGALALGAAGLLQGYRATTHWQYLDLLEPCGALATGERVVVDRNRITGGGVTSGIDFALRVVAELCGARTAQTIQLALEYNPAPPFNSGHPSLADPALVQSLTGTDKARDYHAFRRRILGEALERRGLKS